MTPAIDQTIPIFRIIDPCPGPAVFVRAHGLAEYHRVLGTRGYRSLRPGLDDGRHGSICLPGTDRFGNRIRFDERTEAPEPSAG